MTSAAVNIPSYKHQSKLPTTPSESFATSSLNSTAAEDVNSVSGVNGVRSKDIDINFSLLRKQRSDCTLEELEQIRSVV